MSKEELVSQLTALVEGYTDGLVSANCRLINSGYKLKEEKQEWAQKYHMVMADNKGLEEQNEGLRVEKQALLDVVSEWKSKVQSLNALNATLSGELQELKKDKEILLKTVQNWKRNYTSIKHELDLAQKELAEDNAEKLRLHCLLQSRTEELETAEERYEDFKKRSDGILATMGENLQRRQEQTAALTTWKEGTEKVLDSMEEKLKDYETASKVYEKTSELLTTQIGELYSQLEALKQINSFQEHRIEVLSRKARKLQKKEQND